MVVMSGDAIMAGSSFKIFARMGRIQPSDFAMQMVSINVPETTSATCGSWYWIRIRMKFTLHSAILHSSATLIYFHHALVKSLGEISSSAKPRMIIVEA